MSALIFATRNSQLFIYHLWFPYKRYSSSCIINKNHLGNWKQTSYAMVNYVRNTGQEAVLLAMLATSLKSLKSGGGGANSQVEPRQGWTKTLMKYTYSTCLLIVITLSLSVSLLWLDFLNLLYSKSEPLNTNYRTGNRFCQHSK